MQLLDSVSWSGQWLVVLVVELLPGLQATC